MTSPFLRWVVAMFCILIAFTVITSGQQSNTESQNGNVTRSPRGESEFQSTKSYPAPRLRESVLAQGIT